MKPLDLSYTILNSFNDLKEKYFFQPQLILGGKNFCDISLSDPSSIEDAIEKYRQNYINKVDDSDQLAHLDALADGDTFRMKLMTELGIYPKFLLINHCINL
jgi:hypothetical protein